MNNNALEIPYRLETTEDVDIARGSGIIGEVDYKRLLNYAKEKPLHRPYALINARKKVTKAFTLVDEIKIKEAKISIREVANLPAGILEPPVAAKRNIPEAVNLQLVDTNPPIPEITLEPKWRLTNGFPQQYPLILESIPWIDDIVSNKDMFSYFLNFPADIRKQLLLENSVSSPSSMYASMLAIHKLLKKCLVVYVKAQNTTTLSLIQLKQSLVALTVFDPRNDDVLLALRTEKADENSAIQQNALAEVLFCRLPRIIHGLFSITTGSLIRKLSLKMSRLQLSSRHIMNLMGYFNHKTVPDDLFKTLDRICGVAVKMSIPQESKDRLVDYIDSMKKNMERAPLVYRTIFLSPELETCRKLYQPARLLVLTEKKKENPSPKPENSRKLNQPATVPVVTKKKKENLKEKTVHRYTRVKTLDFYATKDFFDLVKARYSKDCTDTYLGERQLMTKHFFNIRIFRKDKWIGNIYMLDFCDECACLIIDRIQMPRGRKAFYHRFFDDLKDVLIEMFRDVHYGHILMPLKISNHGTIQIIYNQYRKKLVKKEMLIFPRMDQFESIDGKTFYVLHSRV